MSGGPERMPVSLPLVRHPECPAGAVREVRIGLEQWPDGTVAMVYSLEADMARVRIPGPVSARRVDGLWQHTCFEAFFARAGNEAYHEFNFSPSGEWAVYAFHRYREGGSNLAGDCIPAIKVRRAADRLELSAVIPRAFLPPGPADVPFRLGLSAVIEDKDGVLSYWALRHPPGKPDFHHPDAFALELREES